MKIQVRKLYEKWKRWSYPTKTGIIIGMVSVLLAIAFFVYQEHGRSSDKTFLKEQFLETQELCSKNLANCNDKETQEKLKNYASLNDDFYLRGQRAAAGGHFNEARYFYDNLVKANSNYTKSDSFWYEYALILERQKEYGSDFDAYQAATEALQKAVALNDSNLRAFNELGLTYHMLSRITRNPTYYQKALEIYDIVLSRDSKNLDALMGKVYVYYNLQDIMKLNESLSNALRYYPDNTEVLSIYSRYLLSTEDYLSCLRMVKSLVSLQERDFISYDRYLKANIIFAICAKQIGISTQNQTMINDACDIIETIKSQLDVNKLHDNTQERTEIEQDVGFNVKIQIPYCDGWALDNAIEILKIAGDMGKCNDPFDKNLDNKC